MEVLWFMGLHTSQDTWELRKSQRAVVLQSNSRHLETNNRCLGRVLKDAFPHSKKCIRHITLLSGGCSTRLITVFMEASGSTMLLEGLCFFMESPDFYKTDAPRLPDVLQLTNTGRSCPTALHAPPNLHDFLQPISHCNTPSLGPPKMSYLWILTRTGFTSSLVSC